MRKQNKIRQAVTEFLETRTLLSSAPVILKVSDAVTPGNSFTVEGGSITPTGVDVAISADSTAPSLEADFRGTGTGTGGGSDLVTSGGTGALGTTTGVTNSIKTTSEFSTTSGSYLNSSVTAGATGAENIATFTPTAAANSWDGMTGSVHIGSYNYLTLNGGFDVFVRPNATESATTWFRPIDISTISGTSGMRLILTGMSADTLQFQILTGGTALGASAGSFTTNSSFSINSNLNYLTDPFTTGSITHIGVTFSTNASTGLITVSVYALAGTGAIDTTSTTNRLGTQSFYANASIIGANPLPTGAWTMGERCSGASWVATSVDYDSVRLYADTPGIFNGLVATTPPSTPPADAVHPTIIQTDSNSSAFVTATLPASMTSGTYDVWVKNASGWSSPVKMNIARAQYISDYQAQNGNKIEVTGRNFDQSEFGSSTATQVRLNDGAGHLIVQPITSLNPYDIAFTVTGATVGTAYYVEVSNDDGINWSRPSSGQTLTIIATNSNGDPLGLGVSWAQDFAWNSIFNVTTYGATGGDMTDDTTAVKNAIAAANTAGGGVVYFPNGSYYLSGVSIPNNVILEGQSESSTDLVYDNTTGGSSFIRSSIVGTTPVQVQGIARLSITLSDTTIRPDVFLNLGGNSTANRIVVDDVNLTYSVSTQATNTANRGIGLQVGGYQEFLIANNHFSGFRGTMPDNTVTQYCTVDNNYFEYATGYVMDTANYAYFENNTVIAHGELDQESHGIFSRADAYVANNYISGTGSQDVADNNNDGEGYSNEPPSAYSDFGSVSNGSSTSITVSPAVALVNSPTIAYGTLSVLITNGTGMGELEPVASINSTTNVITVSNAFPITPDATSKFSLYLPLQDCTVYDNVLSNCAKGIWFYGDAYDSVAADNNEINSAGIYVHAIDQKISGGNAIDDASYFVRITGNTITGVSARGNYAGIGFNNGRWNGSGSAFADVQDFGMEILHNSITGDASASVTTTAYPGEMGPFSGIYAISYGFSNESNGIGNDSVDTIIEYNVLSNLKYGVTLSQDETGIVLDHNTYDSLVHTFLVDNNSAVENSTNYGVSDNTYNVSNGAPTTNLALSKTATASSTNGSNTASNAVDGNVSTEWSSALGADPQWLQVDLGTNYTITNVTLNWDAFGSAGAYQIQTSLDGTTWTTVYSTNSGTGGLQNIAVDSTVCRYVRVTGTQRQVFDQMANSAIGYSLWEFGVGGF